MRERVDGEVMSPKWCNLVNFRARLWTQVCWLERSCSFHHTIFINLGVGASDLERIRIFVSGIHGNWSEKTERFKQMPQKPTLTSELAWVWEGRRRHTKLGWTRETHLVQYWCLGTEKEHDLIGHCKDVERTWDWGPNPAPPLTTGNTWASDLIRALVFLHKMGIRRARWKLERRQEKWAGHRYTAGPSFPRLHNSKGWGRPTSPAWAYSWGLFWGIWGILEAGTFSFLKSLLKDWVLTRRAHRPRKSLTAGPSVVRTFGQRACRVWKSSPAFPQSVTPGDLSNKDTAILLVAASLLPSNQIFDIKFLLMKLIVKVNCPLRLKKRSRNVFRSWSLYFWENVIFWKSPFFRWWWHWYLVLPALFIL